jgi:hypothetical protein
MTDMDKARAAKMKVLSKVRSIRGVNGVGLTKVGDRYAVKINLSNALQEGTLPDEIDGVPVVSEIVGTISKS